MKKAIIFIICLLCLFANVSCAQNKVSGNGKVTTEDRNLPEFNRIELDGIFNVYLIQGSEEKIKIEIDENLHQYISTEVKGRKLVVSTKDRVHLADIKKSDIYITFKDLNLLVLESIGDVKSKEIKSSNLKIEMNGIGSVSLILDCGHVEVYSDGVGSCSLSGKAKEFILKNNGVGGINASKLLAEKAIVNNSAVGNVSVNAVKELEITNSGIGSITYYGNADLRNVNSSGLGKIEKGN